VDALGIQKLKGVLLVEAHIPGQEGAYLSNDVARLDMSNRLDKLLHCRVVISLRVQVIAILLADVGDTGLVKALSPCDA
jgi:hypothetical protein